VIQLRPYQQDAKDDLYEAWENPEIRNVLVVKPTGAGKTVFFSSVIHDHVGTSCAIAHRQELVGQMSLALARDGVRHRIIGPNSVVKMCMSEHRRELGESLYDPGAQCAVAGVDTVLARKKNLAGWLNQVTLWVQDEAHHVLRSNKWGKVIDLMPHARGLGVTATPIRADGKGLGRHADGVMDALIEGPSMRWLIEHGYLTDYRIFGPPTDLDLSDVMVSASTGDYNQKGLKKAVQKSHLVGDVVDHYLRIAPGKLGVTFATDVETATDIARQFNERGVPAEVVSAKTPDAIRQEILRRFRRRELLQLVNVDLFGEGFDLPAIEVVSMARPTRSYALYSQQFGRALRPMEGKEEAIIIDHAGNIAPPFGHGLPDVEREWSLDARGSTPRAKNPDDGVPLRYCVNCTQPYKRTHRTCPYCGHYHEPLGRDKPEYVDGDLFELSPDVLAQMRAAVEKANEDPISVANRMKHAGAPEPAVRGAAKQIRLRQEARQALLESIAWWAGYHRDMGQTDSESYRLFWHLFGVDVLTAQTLGRPETLDLAGRINDTLARYTR
jgi:DNA repair protein RadD